MRSMTGYGRSETDYNGTKFSVELNSVNRKQSDIVINLPRDLAALEPQIRQTINENISRGRTNVVVSYHNGSAGTRKLALDTELARSYHDAMRALQKTLDAPGEITISAILQAPGVMRAPEEAVDSSAVWPAIEHALRVALSGKRGDLRRSNVGRNLVEHAVDELVSIGAAIGFGELDRFIDDDLVGNLEAIDELPTADHQQRLFDRRKRFGFAIEMRRDARDQCIVIAGDTGPQIGEVRLIRALMTEALPQVGGDLLRRGATHLLFVQALQRELARAPPGASLHRARPAN